MEDSRAKILDYVIIHGPILPVQVSKVIGKDLIFTGAMLSELIANKKLKFSNLKVGGSPLYYVDGQEIKLQRFSKHLSEKPRRAVEILREKRVVRSSELEPWERVAMSEIKDFAVPLRVKFSGSEEIFWKWYMLPNEDVKSILNELLEGKKEVQKELKEAIEVKKEETKDVKEEKPKEIKKAKKKVIKVKKEVSLEFENKFNDYLISNNVNIITREVIKKGKEFKLVADVGSDIGVLRYLVYVKSKKKINESDLSFGYNEGQSVKLPVLFLSDGELTKKAEAYLEKNLKGFLTFKSIK